MAILPHPLHGGAVFTGASIHGGNIGSFGHAHQSISLQTNTPDINLERDVNLQNGEILAGAGTAEISTGTLKKTSQKQLEESSRNRFKVNVATILISALLFLMVLSWFTYLQAAFYSWKTPERVIDDIPPVDQFWYAVLSTVLVLCLVYIIYYVSRDVLV